MAYRIRYDKIYRQKGKTPGKLIIQSLWAGALFCLILLGSVCSAGWKQGACSFFLPQREDVVQTWAQDYARGENLRQILLDRCREILIEAGSEG